MVPAPSVGRKQLWEARRGRGSTQQPLQEARVGGDAVTSPGAHTEAEPSSGA